MLMLTLHCWLNCSAGQMFSPRDGKARHSVAVSRQDAPIQNTRASH